MNDDLNLHDLDERGRAAGTTVMRAAEARPIPELDDSLRPESAPAGDSRRWRTTLVAAAALVALAGAGVLLLRATDGPGTGPDPADTPRLQPLQPNIATELPEDFQLGGAVSTVAGAEPATVAPLDVYGPDPSTPLLGVSFLRDLSEDQSGRRVAVGDWTGYVQPPRGRPVTLFVPMDEGGLLLVGGEGQQALGVDQLVAIGEKVTIEPFGHVIVPPEALPEGSRYLATEPDVYALFSPIMRRNTSAEESHVVDYRPTGAGDSAGIVQVTTSRGGEARKNAIALFSIDGSEITVNGHSALLSTLSYGQADPPASMVSWLDDRGQLIRLYAFGLTEQQVIDVAAGVRPASEEEWAELLRRTPDVADDELEAPAVRLGAGRFADGTAWSLRLLPGDDRQGEQVRLSVDLEEAMVGSAVGGEASVGGDAVFRMYEATAIDDRAFAAGLVTDDVESVELLGADGTSSSATMVRTRNRVAWVAELVESPVTLMARDAEGKELERMPLPTPGGTELAPGGTVLTEPTTAGD